MSYFECISIYYYKVVDGGNGIFLEEGQTKRVYVKATLPIGCSYIEGG